MAAMVGVIKKKVYFEPSSSHLAEGWWHNCDGSRPCLGYHDCNGDVAKKMTIFQFLQTL